MKAAIRDAVGLLVVAANFTIMLWALGGSVRDCLLMAVMALAMVALIFIKAIQP